MSEFARFEVWYIKESVSDTAFPPFWFEMTPSVVAKLGRGSVEFGSGEVFSLSD